MKVFDINTEDHTIILIPRFYPTSSINIVIKKEGSSASFSDIISNGAYSIIDGYLYVYLDNSEFNEILSNNSKYEIKITQNEKIVYRGKAIATDQNTEDYKITKDVYTYE